MSKLLKIVNALGFSRNLKQFRQVKQTDRNVFKLFNKGFLPGVGIFIGNQHGRTEKKLGFHNH